MKAGLTAIISALLLAAACDPGPPRAVNLQVDLAWDAAGAALAQDMATITSDTGYVVELDRLAVTTYSVELMPCDPRPAPKRTTLNIIGTAWAGHQAGHPTTRTNTTGFEVPLKTATIVMEKFAPPDVAYCSAHYLIGRLLDPPPGMDPADTTGFSLRLHGRYRKTDGADWTPLSLETAVAHGILVNFPDPKKGVRFKEGDTVVMTRRLATMFNGVDFANQDEAAVTRQILRQLVAGTAVSWHPASPV